jgi:uncharacterized membrane protein YphA (DoxX/SURF4 family)
MSERIQPVSDASRLDRFLFDPISPVWLGLCRILFFGWLFCWFLPEDLSLVALQPVENWRPILLLRLVGLDQLPNRYPLEILNTVWMGALLMACIGLATRTSCVVSCLIGVYLLGLTHSFWKINHSDAALVISMGILGFSRAGDALSIDMLIQRWRNRPQKLPVPSGEYRWPIQLIRLTLVVVFFAAGVAKLMRGGLEWVFSDNLQTILWYARLTRDTIVSVDPGLPYFGLFCVFAALGAVVLEVICPLALFNRLAAAILIPSLFLLQVGITLIMGDDFTQFAAIYVFWLPWIAFDQSKNPDL